MKRRHAYLAIALLGSLALVWLLPTSADSVVQPTARAASLHLAMPLEKSQSMLASDERKSFIRQLSKRNPAEDELDVFASRSWAIPPLPAAKPVVVVPTPAVISAPVVPPLPFRFLGRYQEEGGHSIFLEMGHQNLIARLGDTLANDWKVEQIEETRMLLRYLPLNETRNLEWNSAR